MTKLEEKLIKLGYKPFYQSVYYDCFIKRIENIGNCNVILDIETKKIIQSYICNIAIHNQNDIDNLQQAFNEMKKDLEVLKDYEEIKATMS